LKYESVERKPGGLPDNLLLRNGSYYADFRVHGCRHRVALGTGSLMLAKQKLKDMIAAAHQGELGHKAEKELTVQEWLDEYTKTHLINRVPRSAVESERLLRKEIVSYLKPKTKLRNVTTAMIIRMRSSLWSHRQASTQNRKLALVKHFFAEARRRKLIKEDPARDVRKLKETNRPSRTLSEFELKRLLIACPEPLRSFVRIAAFTGLRLGELQGLRWKNIEFDPETKLYWIRLRNDSGFRTKSGRDRDVPVHEPIIAPIIGTRKSHDPEELVFKTPLGGKTFHPRRAWRDAIKQLGFKGFTFHGLRRTYGTNLHRNGAPLGSVQKLMGHASITQTRGYIDTHAGDLVIAMHGLDRTLENLGLTTEIEEKVWTQNGHKV